MDQGECEMDSKGNKQEKIDIKGPDKETTISEATKYHLENAAKGEVKSITYAGHAAPEIAKGIINIYGGNVVKGTIDLVGATPKFIKASFNDKKGHLEFSKALGSMGRDMKGYSMQEKKQVVASFVKEGTKSLGKATVEEAFAPVKKCKHTLGTIKSIINKEKRIKDVLKDEKSTRALEKYRKSRKYQKKLKDKRENRVEKRLAERKASFYGEGKKTCHSMQGSSTMKELNNKINSMKNVKKRGINPNSKVKDMVSTR